MLLKKREDSCDPWFSHSFNSSGSISKNKICTYHHKWDQYYKQISNRSHTFILFIVTFTMVCFGCFF